MKRLHVFILFLAGPAAAADPHQYFEAGKAFGQSRKDGVALGINSGQAQAKVPGYNATPPETAHFGLSDLASPRQAKINHCASTPLDPKSRDAQECLAVNLTQSAPSIRPQFNIDPAANALVTRADAIAAEPAAYAGNLDGSFSGCTTKTVTTPAQYSTETCSTTQGVGIQQCTMGRVVNVDADANYKCEQTANAYETLKCKRAYAPVISQQIGCNEVVLLASKTTSTFGGLINESYYCHSGTTFRTVRTNYTLGSSSTVYMELDAHYPYYAWWDPNSYSVIQCDSASCYYRGYLGSGSMYESVTLARPTRPAVAGTYTVNNDNCASLESRAR